MKKNASEMIEEQLQKSSTYNSPSTIIQRLAWTVKFTRSTCNLCKIFKACRNQCNSLPLKQMYPENLIYRLMGQIGVLLFFFIHNILNQVFAFLGYLDSSRES